MIGIELSKDETGREELTPSSPTLDCAGRQLDLSRPQVMGILNLTPDSFSDGGRYSTLKAAVDRAFCMVEEGANLIDVGGESTRPGADDVNESDEISRVVEVIRVLSREIDVPISIDTRKPTVMRAAVDAGAGLINDIRALQEPGALSLAVELDVPVCLMHMNGEPRNMQVSPEYGDVVSAVESFLLTRASLCLEAGLDASRILLDPGIGFGKLREHNVALMQSITKLSRHGYPILIGISRKTIIGELLNGREIGDRVFGSVGAAVFAALSGARMLRVHDVKQTVDALNVVYAITQQGE